METRDEIFKEDIVELKHTWEKDLHFAPLVKQEKNPWLKAACPRELDMITRLGKNHQDGYLTAIERVSGAEVQYQLLIHFHRMSGMLPPAKIVKAGAPVTKEERIQAYNLSQQGKTLTEIAKIIDRSPACVWNMLGGKPHKYRHLTKSEKAEIDRLYSLKTPPKAISRMLEIPYTTVRRHLYRNKRSWC